MSPRLGRWGQRRKKSLSWAEGCGGLHGGDRVLHCTSGGRSDRSTKRSGAGTPWAEGSDVQGWGAWSFSGLSVARTSWHRGCREVWRAASICWGKGGWEGGRDRRTDGRMDVLRAPQPHQDLFKARGALGSNRVEVRMQPSVWTPSL